MTQSKKTFQLLYIRNDSNMLKFFNKLLSFKCLNHLCHRIKTFNNACHSSWKQLNIYFNFKIPGKRQQKDKHVRAISKCQCLHGISENLSTANYFIRWNRSAETTLQLGNGLQNSQCVNDFHFIINVYYSYIVLDL